MSFKINVHHDIKVIEHVHTGEIEKSELAEVWRNLLSMKEFTEDGYNLLTDYSNGRFIFSMEELDSIEIFLDTVKSLINGKRNAVIIDKPNEYVLSMLVGEEAQRNYNFYVELFSTKDAAINFLKVRI